MLFVRWVLLPLMLLSAPVRAARSISPTESQALDIIGRYESDGAGAYNAVNQYGAAGGHSTGREYGFYSGDIRRMPQHGGRALTDMTIQEIMDLQYDNRTLSNRQWRDQGRLHAVGRYQFIGPTLRAVVRQTGINPQTKFTPDVQDALALYLLRAAHSGIGQWVGPASYASSEERRVVRVARSLASAQTSAAHVRQVSTN